MYIFQVNIFWITLSPSYYWLMYVLSFLIWAYLLHKRKVLSSAGLDDLFLYIFLWVFLWGRIGYILFYNLSFYIERPLDILKVWEGWMSFHGWFLWVLLACYLFTRKQKMSYVGLMDELARIFPIGLFFGRIGNYINKELLWFPYTWPLAVQTNTGSYFPSPLLEAFLEWIILFLILHLIYKKKAFVWQLSSLFLIFYWIFRVLVEVFFRSPDSQIGYIFSQVSLWTILSVPMILVWVFLYFYFKKHDLSIKHSHHNK